MDIGIGPLRGSLRSPSCDSIVAAATSRDVVKAGPAGVVGCGLMVAA
jgi:hypothetical protein